MLSRKIFYIFLIFSAGCNMHISESATSYIYESAGYKQCEDNYSSINVSVQKLQAAGINVTSKECGELTDTAMMAVCGAPTTDINILGIAQRDVNKALSLGFTAISSLKTSHSTGYVIKACN